MYKEPIGSIPQDLVFPCNCDAFIMGIVGNTGSGKTVLTQRLIQMWRRQFDVIVWISPTYALQDSHLPDSTGIVVFDSFSKENLEIIAEHQENINKERMRLGEPPSRMLLVLDDNGAKTRKLLQGAILDDILIKNRHYKINTIQLAQRYTQLSPTLRNNAKYLIFFQECNPLERKNLYMYHGFGEKEDYLDTIDKYTQEKHAWIGLKCHPGTYQFFTINGYVPGQIQTRHTKRRRGRVA